MSLELALGVIAVVTAALGLSKAWIEYKKAHAKEPPASAAPQRVELHHFVGAGVPSTGEPSSAPPTQPAPQPQPEVLREGRYLLQSLIGFGVYGPAQGEMWLSKISAERFGFSSSIASSMGRVDSQGEIWRSGGRWFVATTSSTNPILTAYGAVPNDLTRQGDAVTFASQYGTVTWLKQ